MDFVDEKYRKDPKYEPYCLGCRTMLRMDHTETGWKCSKCGAIHDSPTKKRELVRKAFEADAEPYGFDLTRAGANSAVEPWSEYVDLATGHRWGGWLARNGEA